MIDLKNFVDIVIYASLCSLFIMFSGFHWPRELFDYTAKIFKTKKWEIDYNIYSLLKVSKWKNKVPDVSKYFKKIPTKRLTKSSVDSIKILIRETCVAEVAHYLLIILAIPINFISDGLSGFICFLIYSLGNLPYIIIQRYNRPRLIKLLERMENR